MIISRHLPPDVRIPVGSISHYADYRRNAISKIKRMTPIHFAVQSTLVDLINASVFRQVRIYPLIEASALTARHRTFR